jgi:hypothetical protein
MKQKFIREGLMILEEEEEEKPNENTAKANENNVKAKEKEKVVKDIKLAGIPKNNIYYRKNNFFEVKDK